MKNKLTNIFLSVLVGFLFIGCKNSNEQKQDSNPKDIKEEKSAENIITDKLCFQNEYPFQENPSMRDVEELTLLIKGEKVTGTYNWLPAQKDQRKGSLTGTIKEKVITAKYRFLQEGIEGTAELRIIINDEKAEITGGDPELGLNATIVKIDCREQ
jgi:hypothetical protein